jgi:hypothetical protein
MQNLMEDFLLKLLLAFFFDALRNQRFLVSQKAKLFEDITFTQFEGTAQKIIKKMEEEGRITTISREDSAKLDHNLAMAFASIKQESEQKERASRSYVAYLESGNCYNPPNFYQKAKNYFSNLFK